MPSSPRRAYDSYNYKSYQVCVVSHGVRVWRFSNRYVNLRAPACQEALAVEILLFARQAGTSASFRVKNRPLPFRVSHFSRGKLEPYDALISKLYLQQNRTFVGAPTVPPFYRRSLTGT